MRSFALASLAAAAVSGEKFNIRVDGSVETTYTASQEWSHLDIDYRSGSESSVMIPNNNSM